MIASLVGLASGPVLTTQSPRDPVAQGLVAAILVALFLVLALEAAHRVLVALGGVALIWFVTYLTPFKLLTFEQSIPALDLNVLLLLASMMAVVGVLKTTGIFEWAVAHVMLRSGGRASTLLVLVAWFTAGASALLDNVTTVVFLTPMVLAVARQLRMDATALILPMVMASNIGGTATLIGDPPNIMIGSGAGLSFMAFVANLAAPCLVMIAWLVAWSRLSFGPAYASADTRQAEAPVPPPLTDPILAAWMGVICVLVLIGFVTHHLTGMAPAIPATLGAAAALIVQDRLYLRRHRPTTSERIHGVLAVTERDIEWPTLSFFACLFVIVGAAVQTGLIATLAGWLEAGIERGSTTMQLSPSGTLLFAALLICWVSGALSALIDNIPFVAVAIPLVATLTASLPGDTEVLWWALALGACLGGNGSLIGASANVTAAGLAERDGVHITFTQFSRFGAVVATGTLVIASGFLTVFVLGGTRLATGAALVAFVLAAAASRLRGGRPA